MRIGTLKESYAADAALFDSRTQKIWLAIGLALLVLFPFMANDYWLYLACLVAINVASATGLNILTGYTGLVSLGQAAFMGLGAYTVAIMQTRWGTPFALNLVAGGVVAMVGALSSAFHRCASKVCIWRLPRLQPLLSRTFCLPTSSSRAARRVFRCSQRAFSASISIPRSACTG